ncbi:LysR substrate-binding domain-containing protein, partial [Chloroflexota bacterium]
DDSFKVIEQVENGISMVGFGAVMNERPALEYIKIAEDSMVLIVYPGHPLSNQKEVMVSDLLGESLVLRHEPMGMRLTFANALTKAGFNLDQYQPKLILNTTTGVISAVEAKSGIAFVSYSTIKDRESLGLVKVVQIKNLNIRRDLFCIYRKEDTVNSLIMNFVEFATKSFLEKNS